MPGIHIANTEIRSFEQVESLLKHTQKYKVTKILEGDNENLSVLTSSYDGYPIETFKLNNLICVFEGMIYNLSKEHIRNKIKDISEHMDDSKLLQKEIGSLMKEADGEYILFLYNIESKSMVVFNDILGRLPLYYYNENGLFSVSREVKFIKSLIGDPKIDTGSLTEYLLYGFPLGGKTLLKNVKRLMPATVLEFNTIAKRVQLTVLYPVNYENTIEVGKSRKKKISDLKDLFMEVLGNRTKKMSDRQSVIALSGGLDSRATLAGLTHFEKHPKAYTYANFEQPVASQLAGIFNVDLDIIESSGKFGMSEYERLVKMLDGLNDTSHYNSLDYCDKVLELYGDKMVKYSGMYGGEFFRYFNPTSGINSDESLVRFLLSTTDIYRAPVEPVCSIMNVSLSDLENSIHYHISQYPERSVYKKYLHFFFEKNYMWTGAGEDRDKYLFWHTTPFCTHSIYEYALSIDENVKGTLFFRDFLYALDPRLCAVRSTSTGGNLNNRSYLRIMDMPESTVRNPRIRKLAAALKMDHRSKDNENKADLTNLLAGYIDKHNGLLSDYFRIQDLRDSLNDRNTKDSFLHRLLTLSIYINQSTSI